MVPARSCMPAVVAELLQGQPLSGGKVAFAWRVAVGPAIDRVTGVTRREDGTLVVRVADTSWKREIQRSAGLILGRLETLLGTGVVKRLDIP